MLISRPALGLAALLIASPLAGGHAATTSTVLPVAATVLSACVVVAVPLVFGNYQGTQLDATTTIAVSCTNGTTFNVGLDLGSNAASGARRMLGPLSNQYLGYTLARDTGFTQSWGTTVGTDTAAVTSTGLLSTLQVHGRIAAGQYPSPGAYVDTVTVTVTY